MKRFFSTLSALALAVLILMSGTAPALANSAQTYWMGTSRAGAQIQDENCPLVVDHEDLTFRISEFPLNNYASQQEFLDYTGAVTAEYTFRNPADYSVTATLSFPFGSIPSYSVGDPNSDTEKYGVSVNGASVPVVLRHTYSPKFSVEDLALLQNDYLADDFFSPDLPVTKITYAISGIDEEAYPGASASFTYTPHPLKTRYIISNYGGGSFDEDQESIFTWLDNGISFDLYILGEVPDPLPQWMCYKDGSMKKEIPGEVTPVKTETLTFREFAYTGYDPEDGISETDWYNAITTYLNTNVTGSASIDCSPNLRLMRWYQYEITLAPGETLTNTVTAPLYPSIDGRYEPSVYTYNYLLSPAKTWKKFGDIDIRIETPFYMAETKNAMKGFTKDEQGYSLHLPGLPVDDLTFSLSTEEDPSPAAYNLQRFFYTILGLLALLLPLVLVFMLSLWIYRRTYHNVSHKSRGDRLGD